MRFTFKLLKKSSNLWCIYKKITILKILPLDKNECLMQAPCNSVSRKTDSGVVYLLH